jgi:D-serine deaminase-like pyridoxal phosphate-dependent protein
VHVAGLVTASPALRLAGVAGYEGTICQERAPACLKRVIDFMDRLRELTVTLIDTGSFERNDRIVLTAGGSSFFDVVVDRLRGPWPGDADVRVVLRSGCYVTHDAGGYERTSPLPERDGQRGFHQALEVWGHVLSRPEPELALIGFGKRDVPFDAEMPIPRAVRTGDGDLRVVTEGLAIQHLNDQHAFASVAPGFSLDVGDAVMCGIAHPCTAFDKWRVIPILDGDDRVVDAVATYF